MKKIELINAIKNNNGNATKNENVFIMSTDDFNNLLFDIDENAKFTETGKNRIFKIGKSEITIKLSDGKNIKPVHGGNGHKSKNTGYIINIKMVNEKPKTIDNIENCSQIKTWIKSLTRKNVEYLRIYDSMKNECRKSAWIEK